MLRTTVFSAALAASATLALAATDDELRQQIAGSWGADAECAAWSVNFGPDGRYVLDRPGTYQDQMGKWAISAGVLSLAKDTGNPEPDATIAFADDTMIFSGTDRGTPFKQQFTRCRN